MAIATEQVAHSSGEEKLSVGEKVGYALGDAASNLFWKMFEFFLMYFYTDVFGITARSAGTMLLITRIWDAINDPMLGYLADRTKTAWGRFRPYLLWMAVPLAVTGVLTFYTPDISDAGKLVYAYVTYTLVMMAYTAINIPYGALMGVISPSSLERTSVSTYRFVAAFMGGIVVQYSTLHLVRFFGGDGPGGEKVGFFWTMALYAVVAVVLFFITFLTTRERVEPEQEEGSTYGADLRFLQTNARLHQIVLGGIALLCLLATGFSLGFMPWILGTYAVATVIAILMRARELRRGGEAGPSTLEQDFNDLLSNRPWLALFGFGLMQLTALFIRGGAILYYFKYFCHRPELASTFLVAGSVAAIVGMLFTKYAVSLLGKKQLMILMNVGVAILTAGFFLLQPEQIGWMFAFHVAAALISGPTPVVLWAMYADTADHSEWKNRRRATGLIFSAATFAQKMGCAVGSAMTGFALDYFQYTVPAAGVEQTQGDFTLFGLRMMMSVIPAVFLFAAAGCLVVYDIGEPLLRQIETDLAQRRRKVSPATDGFPAS
jgi:GPH family glycoside/pentoside/hexuronide:cation symporter